MCGVYQKVEGIMRQYIRNSDIMEGQILTKLNDTNVDELIDLSNETKKRGTAESYTYLKKVLSQYSIPCPTLYADKSIGYLARSRMHLDGEILFGSIQDVSYRKDDQNIRTFGRANEPGQSIFYCSNSYHAARIETSEITRQNVDKDWEYTTTGAWEIQEELCLISILTNQDMRGENTPFDNTSYTFESMIEQLEIVETKAVLTFLNYISEEFRRRTEGNSTGYLVRCAFFNYALANLPYIDGFLFPSTLYQTEGVNLALKPSSIDRKLRFHSARRGKLQRVNLTDYGETQVIESEIHNMGETKIRWKI